MRKTSATAIASAACGLLIACGGQAERQAGDEDAAEQAPLPFERISSEGDDPAEMGPDDSTVLAAMPKGYGEVKFSHFTHASNAESGYGVPCRECHHATPAGEDPAEGCAGCHEVPRDTDPAHRGPSDALVLVGDEQNLDLIGPVPFNHYTHASSSGYKIACDRCHHSGDMVACTECHGEIAKQQGEGVIVPKAKRAFHLQCAGCHEATADNDPDTPAPTSCDECHTEHGPDPLGGHLTLDRALHLMCVGCHEKVETARPGASAPTRECADCHEGGYSGEPYQPLPEEKPEPEPEPEPEPSDAEQEESGEPPATLKIELGERGKETATFTHEAHFEYAESCKTCHHEGLEDPKCSGCHEPGQAKDIYHELCITCHRENGGPTSCGDCHP
ncbi:MAG: cytochrome c3 family protein [Polyangia bacterium]